MAAPSNLPFHLLAWGQQYVKGRNCQRFYKPQIIDEGGKPGVHTVGGTGGLAEAGVRRGLSRKKGAGDLDQQQDNRIDERLIPNETDSSNANWDGGVYEICRAGGVARSHGGPVNVTYIRRNHYGSGGWANYSANSNSSSSRHPQQQHVHPIRFVYFSESDQVVSFDSDETLRALSAASNESCFFTGRRREKAVDSEPADYMGGLTSWRNCGAPGYSLHWPRDVHVRME